MALRGFSTLLYYSQPPHNYIGTTIFLSYIVLALYATLNITSSLSTQYNKAYHLNTPHQDATSKAAQEVRKRHIKIYAFLSSISFATLSYHMLFYLITHYLNWTGKPTRSITNVSSDSLKSWMLSSTLFQDFATELVAAPANTVYTQVAILATFFWNMWIAKKAREHHLRPAAMWTYILLSQILPISFTSALLITSLHIHLASSPMTQAPKPTTRNRQIRASPLLPTILLNCALLALPTLSKHAMFIPLVLFSRFVLCLPHSGMVRFNEQEVRKCLVISAGSLVAYWASQRQELRSADRRVLRGNLYAVRALGWDALLGGVI
ncbi:hypothetical protein EK21DRAFT_29936, partial [Setomelanomma holmii]